MARSVRLSSIRETLTQLGATVAATLALGGAAIGCAPGNPGMVVINQLAPSDECIWDPAGIEYVAEPVFDLDPLTPSILGNIGLAETRPTYIAQFLVLNNLINRFSTSYPVMADPNVITAARAEIELLRPNGSRFAAPAGFYSTRASGTVVSALGDQPGRGLVRVDVIPSTVADALAIEFGQGQLQGDGLVTARVVIIGLTQGGTEVRTAPFVMPISLCYGCLYVDRPLMTGENAGCTPGQDQTFVAPGFTRTPPCVDAGECVSGACVLGHCARDLL